MEQFPLTVSVDDRHVAKAIAGNLTYRFVDFAVTFNEGRLQWTFHFAADDAASVGLALVAAIKATLSE